MKFTIKKSAALAALSRVADIIPEKHTVPILTNVAIEAFADGSVVFRGKGDSIEAIGTADALVEKAGATTVPSETLADIVRRAKADDIGFNLGDRLEVRSGRSIFRLATLPISDMPQWPAQDYDCTFQVSGHALANAIEKARAATQKGKSIHSVAISGVRMAVHGDELHVVATNGNQYVRVRMDRPSSWPDGLGVTISPEVLDQITAVCGQAEVAEISLSASRIAVMADHTFLSGVTMSGTEYPDYKAMGAKFSGQVNTHMRVNRPELIDAISRILSVGNVWQKSDRGIKIECEADHLTISAQSYAGDALEHIEVEDGAPMTLGYNPDFLLPMLQQLDGDTVIIGITHKGDRQTESATLLSGDDEDVLVFCAQRKV